MSWFRFRRKREAPCNDYLTRLGSKELAQLQDAVRNATCALESERRQAFHFIKRAFECLQRMETIERKIEEALNPIGKEKK